MAQLSDDCFAGDDALLPLDTALARLADNLRPVTQPETVALTGALGRVLTEDIVATTDVPPTDNAAVDGFAVHFDDLSPDQPTTLTVAGRAAAGHPHAEPVARGTAIRIFTGAPMPDGPDTVLMQEDCRVEGDTVVVRPGISRGANARAAGEDIRRDAAILRAGHRLAAADIGLAAAAGHPLLPVSGRLRVAVFSTGDEIAHPGAQRSAGAIYDANRFALANLLIGLGCQVSDLGILADDPDAIAAALSAAAEDHHAIVTSGGMSQGEEDHVAATVTALGSLYFWRLAIKPGRPVAMGQVASTAFFGLPGNPAAMMVTFLVLVRPALLRLAGANARPPHSFHVPADFAHTKKPGRREYLRASLTGAPGSQKARKFPVSGAGILRSLVESDGLVELAEDTTQITPGTEVPFTPFSEYLI